MPAALLLKRDDRDWVRLSCPGKKRVIHQPTKSSTKDVSCQTICATVQGLRAHARATHGLIYPTLEDFVEASAGPIRTEGNEQAISSVERSDLRVKTKENWIFGKAFLSLGQSRKTKASVCVDKGADVAATTTSQGDQGDKI